jgi:pilus assembly protein Flp/PilA
LIEKSRVRFGGYVSRMIEYPSGDLRSEEGAIELETSQLVSSGMRNYGGNRMNSILINLYIKFQALAKREDGQDLVEYALVVALIAFGATAGMRALSLGLNKAFEGISTTLGSYVG